MADSNKGLEDSPIRGFSIVDSLPFIITSPEREDSTDATEVSVVQSEGGDDDASTENVKVTNGEQKDDIDTFILDETDHKDDRELNQGTLIITTEDILDSTAVADDVPEPMIEKISPKASPKASLPEPTSEKQKITDKQKTDKKSENQGYFWVSNINRQVKAADLKKFFSQIGKVLTAKILTNGRNYFGYVSMESTEVAAKCIRQLNNTPFDGKKIVVSKDRPDVRTAKAMVVLQKAEPKKKKAPIKVEPKKEDQKLDNVTELLSLTAEVKEKRYTEDSSKYINTIADLKKKLERAKGDTEKYRTKVMEFQRRHDGMRKKCDNLEHELKDSEFKVREERRKLNRDREQFEKTKKLEQIRFEADRAVVNRELDEVKKLREHLKQKIDEFKAQSKKVVKRRSRSPPVIRGRGRSPPLRPNDSNAFRLEDRKRKREVSRGRTPPPPPKLGDVGKKRSEREVAVPSRSYFGDSEKRPPVPSQGYEFRHKPGYGIPSDEFRGHWPSVFQKDPRRPSTGASSSQSFPSEVRFGTYQYGSSSLSTPSRSYYPEFGKSYGTY